MYLEQKLIPRGKKLYLVRLYEFENANDLSVECLVMDKLLGTIPMKIDGNIFMFLPIGYRRDKTFSKEERLKAYVHFNNLVSLFRDHDVYGDVT